MNEIGITQQAGLTLYQTEAYLALKQERGPTPTEVGHRSGVSQAKIYATLYAPENLGLVSRYLDKQKAVEIDRRIIEFLIETKSHPITLKTCGRGGVKQAWSTNGASLTLVNRRMKELERSTRSVARYWSLTSANAG